ncbi:MAG: YbaB/EbfC family nucleoid-associated protein [Aerococcaceae bacterium]|nr:YbaB/EbfC family nucleoid-associated protein [Aerococcaceae bacterium]
MRGMGNMGNMQGMMQKVQKMQKEMAKEQAAIEATIFEASDAQQLVTAKVNGKKELVELNLSEQLVDPDDVDMLQDLVIATVNMALKQVDEATETRLGKYTKGLNLPF